MTSSREAFEFIELNPLRSQAKPRAAGLTLISEWGMGLEKVRDLLHVCGRYLDYAKIAAGSPRLYRRDVLMEKLALYRSHEVRPYLGGQFQEFVFANHGEQALKQFLAEARDIGFKAAELSENYVALSSEERRRQLGILRDHGFETFGEAGSKEKKSNAVDLIRQMEELFDAGAQIVLLEGAELIDGPSFRIDLFKDITNAVDVRRIMFELPTVRTGASLDRIHDVKKMLIKQIGPDVNIANLPPDDIMETEALRQGLGVVGPSFRRPPKAI